MLPYQIFERFHSQLTRTFPISPRSPVPSRRKTLRLTSSLFRITGRAAFRNSMVFLRRSWRF
ncbi:hypothetical protein PO124_00480 [Bacillus licheniformis]|nr:hypothetical protein [Bacillus licheniformis]